MLVRLRTAPRSCSRKIGPAARSQEGIRVACFWLTRGDDRIRPAAGDSDKRAGNSAERKFFCSEGERAGEEVEPSRNYRVDVRGSCGEEQGVRPETVDKGKRDVVLF